MAAKIRTQLLAAADAASVGSVAKTSAALAAAATMSSDGPIPAGATDATKIFNAQLIDAGRLLAHGRDRDRHQERQHA